MPVGTAAPTVDERAAVPHHLVEFLDPYERYSAARYAHDAFAAIDAIQARGKRAIVVGGTGFYVRALTGDVALAPQHDPLLRERLAHEARIHDSVFLHEWLALRDPRRAAQLSPGDTYRILRALEVALSEHAAEEPRIVAARHDIVFVKYALDVPQATIDTAISRRSAAMLEHGLLEEAQRFGPEAVAASAVGYPQALGYLRGWCTREELLASLNRATRRYARRQRSWLRSEPNVRWIEPAGVLAAAGEIPGWS